jgi:hypothetical protein
MDLFVTLNVATFKSIVFIPICSFFFFFEFMEITEQSTPCCHIHMLFEVKPTQNHTQNNEDHF